MSISFDKYSVTQYSVSSLLGFIEAGAIAVPEIQRPFVWRATQVPLIFQHKPEQRKFFAGQNDFAAFVI